MLQTISDYLCYYNYYYYYYSASGFGFHATRQLDDIHVSSPTYLIGNSLTKLPYHVSVYQVSGVRYPAVYGMRGAIYLV